MRKNYFAGSAVWLLFMLFSGITNAVADVEMGEVVVTATKTERKSQDVTQSVTVITADDIQKSGATNIGEVVGTTAGATVTDNGAPGSLQSINLRGSTSEQVLVLLDGKRLNSGSAGGYDLSDLPVPIDAIERIEIVRGPASALYGADAVGGVVNIITKKPSKTMTTVSGAVGEHGYATDSIYNSGRNGNTYYALSYGKEHSSGYRIKASDDAFRYAGQNINNNNLDQYNAGIKLGYDLDSASSIEGTADYIRKDIGAPGSVQFPFTVARETDYELVTGLQYKQRLSKSVDFSVRTFQNEQRIGFHNPDPDPSLAAFSKMKSTTFGAETQVNWIMNSFSVVTVGAEERDDSMVITDVLLDNIAHTHTASIFSGYIQDELSLGDSIILVLGGRNDTHSIFGSEWSPKASARYIYAGTGTIVRASYGKSFRAPTLNELYFQDSYGDTGNPNLQPEEAEEYEGSIEQPFGKGNSIRFTAFKRRVKDLILWQTDPTTFISTPTNTSRAQITGTETELHFVVSQSFSGNLSYTQMFPVDKTNGSRLFSDATHIPAQQLGGTLFVALDQETTLTFDGKSVWNYVEPGQPDMAHFKQYYVVDGKITDTVVSKKDLKAQVFIGMKNIFDRTYETVKGYPMPPKTFYGGITATF
jgi:outer membrane cobalamin receptor